MFMFNQKKSNIRNDTKVFLKIVNDLPIRVNLYLHCRIRKEPT